MSSSEQAAPVSPWRRVFEQVRDAAGGRRDDHGVLGSINWLRHRMEARGANPNVVRNIIYRDKGKLADKRVLFDILRELWALAGEGPLRAPEIELLLSEAGSAEHDVLQLLGREKRRAFRAFVSAVRAGRHPKLLVTGRPGSGKTMLTDYIQQALQVPPDPPARIVRAEFGNGDLGTGLTRLGHDLGVPRAAMEARLAKIGTSSAYAVQADAQADLARAVLEALREHDEPCVLLLHVSRSLVEQDTLGTVPLRLNTHDVPRVSAPEWLWVTLLEPLAKGPATSVLVSMTDLPARALQRPTGYEGPVKLTPPTPTEARRFIRARLPHLRAGQHEEIAQRAGRSFEDLRTLTLLAEIRTPLPAGDAEGRIARLSELVANGGDPRLRGFLAALATVSLPDFPTFDLADLTALRTDEQEEVSELERAFVDPVPGVANGYRCFSRALASALRERLEQNDPSRHRALHAAAAERFREAAEAAPTGEAASRMLHHLHEARSWEAVVDWMRRHGVPQSLVGEVWKAAQEELAAAAPERFEEVAVQVATHYVKLGSYRHPDAVHACGVLVRSPDPRRRAWATLKQAEGAVLRGRHDEAEALLADWPGDREPLLEAEAALVRASIARWRGDLARAARIVDDEARPLAASLDRESTAARLARAKVAIWSGLIEKDRGDLEAAVRAFDAAVPEDDLLRARLAFHSADVLMALGRLGASSERFDLAVDLSGRSGALVTERARYLARRARLRRRRGDLAGAEADLDAADAILADADGDRLEHETWATRVDEQRALLLLARGRHDEAIGLLAHAVARVRAYAEAFGVDARYAIHRAMLRLAVAHAARGLGAAWGPPFPHRTAEELDRPDLAQARRLLDEVIGRLDGPQEIARPDPLAGRALLVASLVEPPEAAVACAERALGLSRFARPRAEALVHAAAAHLRAGDPAACGRALDTARDELERAPVDEGDPGLDAWAAALRLRAHVAVAEPEAAAAELARLLDAPLPDAMRSEALRAYGDALEAEGRVDWLEREDLPAPLGGGAGDGTLRPGDLLVSRLRGRADHAPVPTP